MIFLALVLTWGVVVGAMAARTHGPEGGPDPRAKPMLAIFIPAAIATWSIVAYRLVAQEERRSDRRASPSSFIEAVSDR